MHDSPWFTQKCQHRVELKLLQEGGTPSRARNWAVVYHLEMNCSRRHMCWQSKRFYWERAPGQRVVGWEGELLCPMAPSLRFYGDGVHALFSQGGCEQGFWEVVWQCGVSFWSFSNSSCWWWLISFMSLTRTSCHKTTHANGYVVPVQGGQFQSVCFP